MNKETHTSSSGQEFLTRLDKRTEDAFAEGERQGVMLAAKVRTVALLIILFRQAIDNPDTGLAYAYGLMEVAAFGLLGLLQLVCAKQRFNPPVLKYLFVLVDCVLLALVLSFESPFDSTVIPAAVVLESSRASFFYIFLMQSTFSLRPQLVLWCGLCIVTARTAMLVWFVNQPDVFTNIKLLEQTSEAYLRARSDPNFVFLGFWATDIIVTLIVAAGLAVVVKRSRSMVESRSLLERTRASLARYFSPNVVDHLSSSRHLLIGAREQKVAILFTDIMGFTKLCENTTPVSVIALLSEFHNRLGQAVFNNQGTMDKYLGDGFMATFGTPESGPNDAGNSLRCAKDMIEALAQWNTERVSAGAVPLRVGIGLHYGLVIAGDIGNERRLEYSVIGDTVNIASRLEQLTRNLGTPLVVSDTVINAITSSKQDENAHLLNNLIKGGVQKVRGRVSGVTVWTLAVDSTDD